jgi:hypothetical protein
MDVISLLLAASAIVGLVLGLYFSWIAIAASGLALAIVSATVLQKEDFDFLPGIAIAVVCLTVNHLAYLVGGEAGDSRFAGPIKHRYLMTHVQIPAHRGQSFRRIADSNPVIADSF